MENLDPKVLGFVLGVLAMVFFFLMYLIELKTRNGKNHDKDDKDK